MEANMFLSCLNCGSNGTGVSTLLSVESHYHCYGGNGENAVHLRVLINCGDSTQRFCGDNRIKLSRVCLVILTSLAPHNMSGLPGIILCLSDLGVGKLKIIGPAGLKNLLHQMKGFTNRRYPELDILEITEHAEEFEVVKLDSLIVKIKSVQVANSSQSPVISLAAIFTIASNLQSNIGSLACIPLASFDTSPSLTSICSWAKSENASLVLFSPIQAISCESSNKLLYELALKQCKLRRVVGLIMQVRGDSEICEFQQAQTSLAIHKRLSPLTFPKSMYGLDKSLLSRNNQVTLNATVNRAMNPKESFKNEEIINTSNLTKDIYKEQHTHTSNNNSNLSTLSWHANDDLYGVYGAEEFTELGLPSGYLLPGVPLLCFRLHKLFHHPISTTAAATQQQDATMALTSSHLSSISEPPTTSISNTGYPVDNSFPSSTTTSTSTVTNVDKEVTDSLRRYPPPPSFSSASTGDATITPTTPSQAIPYDDIYLRGQSSLTSCPIGNTGNTSIITGKTSSVHKIAAVAKSAVSESSSAESDDDDNDGTGSNPSSDTSSSSSNESTSDTASTSSSSSSDYVSEEDESNTGSAAMNPSYSLAYHRLTNALSSLASRCDSHITSVLQGMPPIEVDAAIPVPYPSRSQGASSTPSVTPLETRNRLGPPTSPPHPHPPLPVTTANNTSPGRNGNATHPPLLPLQPPPVPASLPPRTPLVSNFSAADQLRAKLLSRKRSLPESTDKTKETPTDDKKKLITNNIMDINVSTLPPDIDNKNDKDLDATLTMCRSCRNSGDSSDASIPVPVPPPPTPAIPLPAVPPPSPLDLYVCFLGTGSAKPSPHRSNSCILLRSRRTPSQSQSRISVDKQSSAGNSNDSRYGTSKELTDDMVLLLDVGEGAASQLFQSVSGDHSRMCALLRDVRIVWISHHHADHHCGLPMLLAARASYHQSYDAASDWGSVLVVAPPDVLRYHEYVTCVSGLDGEVRFISTVDMNRGRASEVLQHSRGHISGLRSIPVQHCYQSYGVVIHFAAAPGRKVVYSGDCRPSPGLVTAGLHCDLLIHEATFDDSKQEDALCKRHSTVSEAVQTAVQMGARHVVLTHFSQRYPSAAGSHLQLRTSSSIGMEQHSTLRSVVDKPFSVAFDFLSFSFPSQIEVLPSVCDYMVSILSRYEDEKKNK